MIKQFHANRARLRRHYRVRRSLAGSQERPRLNVFRSGQHIYAQVIDDTSGRTLASASSLEESLRNFKPAVTAAPAGQAQPRQEQEAPVEMAAEAAPVKGKGKAAKTEKAPKAEKATKAPVTARGGGKGQPATQAKTVLPSAQKGARKTPVEALMGIASNRKVAIAREVGKLVAQRAKEKGVTRVVFDRGGYTYHGRVAALAEGAREAGLDF